MSRQISYEINWQTAAQIIAATLENGADKGRDSARAELFRMAKLLDDNQAAASVDLWEVICFKPELKRTAFGVTFHEQAAAEAYKARMEKAGYTVDPSPNFQTEPDLKTALAAAANHFQDPTLTEPSH